MKKLVTLLLLISGIFLGNFVSATVSVNNYSIGTSYSFGENLTGSITLNLNNVPYNSYLVTNHGQRISLIDLFGLQPNFAKDLNYTCTPYNCNPSYVIVPGSTGISKSFKLDEGKSRMVGLVINGSEILGLQDYVNLTISTDAPKSDNPQLTVDIFNESRWITEWYPTKWSGQLSDQVFVGCYNSTYVSQQIILGTTAYCEKITIPKTPLVQLGTTISGSGSSDIKMYINDSYGNQIGSCTIPKGTYLNSNLNCVAKKPGTSTNTSITNLDNYFVCVKLDTASGNNYNISIETTSPKCGFLATSPNSYIVDYNLYARPGTYDSPIGFVLSGANFPFNSIVSSSLKDIYNNDCTNGCVIPVRINSYINQTIGVYGLSIKAETPKGLLVYNNLSNVSQGSPVTLSTVGLQKFSLDKANFSVGNSYGNNQFILSLDNGTTNTTLISKTINIRRIPKVVSLSPEVVAAGIPSNFTVKVDKFGGNSTISSYRWDFGDNSSGSIVTTYSNTTTYTYNKIGTFQATIKLTDSNGATSSENFSIAVSTPKDAVNLLLLQKLSAYNKLHDLVSQYPTFTQNALTQILNLNNVSTKLTDLQGANKTASSDDKYVEIIKQLLNLQVPNVNETVTADNIPFIPLNSSINLDELKSVGGGTYDSNRADDYAKSIIGWDISNASMVISYKEFSSIYKGSTQPLLDVVKIQVNSQQNAYLMIKKLDNMQFDASLTKTASGDYYYLPLDAGSTQTIYFSTTESIAPLDVPVFVAPSLERLPLPPTGITNTPSYKWVVLVFILMGILIGGFVIYIILGKWYQKRYESYLFNNKNDLYNIVTYVHGAKSRGVKDKEIERSLRGSRWNSEQISYVMKRYAGKKVGLMGFAIRGNKPNKNHKR